jgi:hypothetical protein
MKKKLFPEIVTLLLVSLCILTVVLVHHNVDYDRYASAAATPFFLLKPDDVTEEQIPEYAGIRRTYTFTIPDSASATTTGARLTVFLRHTLAELYIDDTIRYSNDPGTDGNNPSRIGNTPGNYWVSIPIRPEYAGKTVRIILTPVYQNVLDEKPEFRIVTRDMLLSMIVFPENGLMIVLSLLAAASGIFLAIMSLVLPLERPEKQQIFFLGAVAVTAGIWKLCGLPAVTLLLEFRGIHKEIWFAGTVSYMLMLFLSLRMILTIRGETDHLIGRVCLYTGAAAVAALILLQIFGVLELYQALVWYGIGMVILHLLPFAKQKPARAELMWIIPLFLTLGADLLIALHNQALSLSPVFLIWLILYLYVRGFGFVRGAILRKRLLQKKQEELREAKVRTMMNQIRPHFIYNTLTSVYVLCRDDPERAALMVQYFTEYLQSNFTAMTATELISFPDELRHTKAYISMESFRYRDKLTVEYDVRHSAFRLPALTLQPLVENAIKHYLGKGIAPEHIVISSWAEGSVSCNTVKDNGPGFDPQEQIGEEHVGLENVRERLQLMCGGTLDIQSSKDSGTLITISIPTSRTGDMLP